jgi:hypothetical protein
MATTTIAAQQLGKLPARTDVRTISLARYVDTSKLPPPPDTFDEAARVTDWPVYANDRIGDCTTAAAGHMIEAWTAAAHGEAVEIPESAVLEAFDHVKQVDPFTGQEGAIVLDVLKLWRKTGIGDHRIGAYARVSVHDEQLVRSAAWLFGGLYLGLQLPLSAQQQSTWDWSGTLTGPAAPGRGEGTLSTSSATARAR